MSSSSSESDIVLVTVISSSRSCRDLPINKVWLESTPRIRVWITVCRTTPFTPLDIAPCFLLPRGSPDWTRRSSGGGLVDTGDWARTWFLTSSWQYILQYVCTLMHIQILHNTKTRAWTSGKLNEMLYAWYFHESFQDGHYVDENSKYRRESELACEKIILGRLSYISEKGAIGILLEDKKCGCPLGRA